MRKLSLLLPAICLALTPFTAKADPVLTFNSSSSNIGPYSLTLTPPGGALGSLSLFCLNDNDFIQPTESWNVQVILGSQLATNLLTMAQASLFEEEAFIVSRLSSSNDTDVQEALWHIFDNSSPDGYDVGAQNLVNSPLLSAFITSGGFDNYQFYIYDPCVGCSITDQDTNPNTGALSLPQNFIGITTLSTTAPTPEPSTLLMLGTGLAALAGAARRKMVRG